MKPVQAFLFIAFLICIADCANKGPADDSTNEIKDTTSAVTSAKDSFETGKIIEHVACRNDSSQSYALYIPSATKNEPVAEIYFFDPHADGSLPLKKYKALADKFNFVLIGSNNSKNGNDWPTTEYIWNSLFNDSRSRLTSDPQRLYTCGFSGGAKVAGYIALHNSVVTGAIANGAGLPDETPAGNFNFSFTGIAGKGDMNMTDLIAINNDFDKTQTRHRIILFNGKHEWAPENVMSIALEGLQLDAMQNHLLTKDDAFISHCVSEGRQRVSTASNAGNLMDAAQECSLSISMLDSLTDEVNWFKQKDASIRKDPSYQKQLQARQNLFNVEQNTKAEYARQFRQGDMNYWTSTINNLRTNSNTKTDEGAMYQRLLAYLSLAFYSISNQLIDANQDEGARYFVELYKKADPSNSEAWYFSAILDARANDAKAAIDDLLRAVDKGFTDKNRMLQQQEFKNHAAEIPFAVIESKMKKGE